MHEPADLFGGDDVLAALKDQRWNCDLGKVLPVVGGEGNACERLGDFGIGSAETVGQFFTQFRALGLPMMEGAIAADQPMWLSSRNSSSSAICFSLNPPT